MPSVTFDTNIVGDNALIDKARGAGYAVAYASPTLTETVTTEFESKVREHARIPAVGEWNESLWNEERWGDETSGPLLAKIETIIANGPIPPTGLTPGQVRQRRDARILEAHAAAGRDVFVTNDSRGYISHGRREKLEGLLGTRIRTAAEFDAALDHLLEHD